MARKKKLEAPPVAQNLRAGRLAALAAVAPVAGVPGPGHWLIVEYQPTALFSLKMSQATSSVGKTLVVPTPYSIKMAFVDAAFRAGLSDAECDEFLRSLARVEVRIAPPEAACVTHTFVKVRQESRDADPLRPYIASIAYREVVHHYGTWRWAFDLAAGDSTLAERLVYIAPHVVSIGKRGSFIQFVGFSRRVDLGPEFTQPVQNQGSWRPPRRAHIMPLDDFGPEADLETLSSFTPKRPVRGKHRRFVATIIPLGLVNTGPGFREYRAT
ncbi:MAG: hypothetical protein NZ578_13445 [Candidatus Binatia bacterium]|nr:hypothetical protein [Candidatus Binatia bacterium]